MKTQRAGVKITCVKMEIILVMFCFQTLYFASSISDKNFFYHSTAVNGSSIICLSCPPGTYLERGCTLPKSTGRCQICPVGYFQPFYTNFSTCLRCVTKCLHTRMENNSEPAQAVCESTKNFCSCQNKSCILDSKCPPGKEPAIQATSSQHTTCNACPEETFSDVYSRTEMCKPKTQCGPHEVAILDGDKSRDRVCIPRNGDFNHIGKIPTTPLSTYNATNHRITTSDRPQARLTTYVIIVINLMVILIAIGLICVLRYIWIRTCKRTLNDWQENTPCANTDPDQDNMYTSSDSGVLDVDERSMRCSYNKTKRDNRPMSCSTDKVCMLPLLDDAAVYTSRESISLSVPLELASTQEPMVHNLAVLENDHILRRAPALSPLSLKTEALSTQVKCHDTTKVLISSNAPFEKTKTLPCSHVPKRKTILSTNWQCCEHIDNQGCILQLPNSDVITTFPPGVFSDGSSGYCHKTVHNDIPRLAAELRIPHETVITSPAPEYYMQKTFTEFVEIQIPHRQPKNYKQIKVLSFLTHTASKKVDLVEVQRYDDKPKTGDNIDMFCVINSISVVIYTKHFSGFVCTICQTYIEYNLSASIYGRKGLIDGRIDTLDVVLYLKGAKATITDFGVTMVDKLDERFHHLETTRVKLLDHHEQREGGQLQFRFGLVSESVSNWTHRKDSNDDQFQLNLVLVNPEELMRECETHIIYSPDTKWHLQRRDEANKNCDFYIEIVHKEKPPLASDTLRHVKTCIPASEHFAVAGALSVASGITRPNVATIPEAITDVVMTLKEHLSQDDSLKLVKRMGCLGQIPAQPDRRQRDDFRFDYWYNAFLLCYDHLQDQFIIRVLEGLRKMGHEQLASLVDIHAPESNARIARISPNPRPVTQEGGGHIAQPSSADSEKDD